MTVRRRITIAIDDSVDSHSPTPIHIQPDTGLQSEDDTGTRTDLQVNPSEDAEEQPLRNQRGEVRVGRTFADLVVEFKNDNRGMAIALTILPVALFVVKIDSVDSLKFPLIVAIVLNLVWFAGPSIVSLFQGKKSKL